MTVLSGQMVMRLTAKDSSGLRRLRILKSSGRLQLPLRSIRDIMITKGLAADDVVASMMEDPLTVKLKEAVTPYLLDLCAFPFFFPVNQKSVEGNDDWANDASDKFVTNGAFTLKEEALIQA